MDSRKLTSISKFAMTNRNIGSVQAPSPNIAGAELTTELSTYIAKPPIDGQLPILYNGDRQFAEVILELQTAGPVFVGTKQQILPLGSCKGQQLFTGQQVRYQLPKGNRLWVATGSISLIAVTIQAYAWLENITGLISSIEKKR